MLDKNTSITKINLNKLLIIILILLIINILNLVFKNNCESVCIKESSTLYNLFEKENVLAMNSWDINNKTYLCIVTVFQEKLEDTFFENRKLIFFEKSDNGFNKVHEFKTIDSFLSMYPLYDNGNLLTIWISGSAYHVNIFSLINNKIKIVLEIGTKNIPEIVDIDDDGKIEILISEGSLLITKDEGKIIAHPNTTNIYKWNGHSYYLLKTVPWKKRMQSF